MSEPTPAVSDPRPTGFKSTLARLVGSSTSQTFIRAFLQTTASALSAAPGGLEAIIFGVAGGVIGAATGVWADFGQAKTNAFVAACLEKHDEQFTQITSVVFMALNRANLDDDSVRQRVEGREYQALVQKAFSNRAAYETDQKRELLRKLLAHAATPGLTPDDLIRLFIDWVGRYHDLHFRVMAILRGSPMSTRRDIWLSLHGENVREDSAEADLFGVLIMDLSFGHVIRQHKERDSSGRAIKSQGRSRVSSPYMKSRFDDVEPYVLTELGDRFIHHVMDELVPKLTR